MDSKILVLSFALAFVGAGAMLPGPGFAQGGVESPQALEMYRIRARQDLDLINERLSTLELEARVEQKRAREGFQTRTGELRAEKKEADILLGRIETGTDQDRRAARSRLDEAIRGLKTGIERAEGAHRGWGS